MDLINFEKGLYPDIFRDEIEEICNWQKLVNNQLDSEAMSSKFIESITLGDLKNKDKSISTCLQHPFYCNLIVSLMKYKVSFDYRIANGCKIASADHLITFWDIKSQPAKIAVILRLDTNFLLTDCDFLIVSNSNAINLIVLLFQRKGSALNMK